jgi:hypothetical protein
MIAVIDAVPEKVRKSNCHLPGSLPIGNGKIAIEFKALYKKWGLIFECNASSSAFAFNCCNLNL